MCSSYSKSSSVCEGFQLLKGVWQSFEEVRNQCEFTQFFFDLGDIPKAAIQVTNRGKITCVSWQRQMRAAFYLAIHKYFVHLLTEVMRIKKIRISILGNWT